MGVEGGQVTRADFALLPDLDPPVGAIRGRVVGEDGLPIVGAYVFWAPLAIAGTLPPSDLGVPENPEDLTIAPPPTVMRTDQNGEYLIRPLIPGRYVVIAWALGYDCADHVASVPASGTAICDFRLRPEEPIEPGFIRGQVCDRETGEPIAGAWVFYGPTVADHIDPAWGDVLDNQIPHVRTNENGVFEIGPIRPGLWHLRFQAEGYHPAHETLEVGPGQTVEVKVHLEPFIPPDPGWIHGQVVDGATGIGLAGAFVFYGPLFDNGVIPEWWNETDPANVPHVRTDENGFYEIPNLRPQLYYLLAKAPGYLPEYRQAPVEPGHGTEANFELFPEARDPGVIEGNVSDGHSGQGIPLAKVYYLPLLHPSIVIDEGALGTLQLEPDPNGGLIPPPPDEGPFVETDDAGNYHIGPLQPGSYQLVVVKEGYRSQSRVVEVHSNHVTEANFELFPIPSGEGAIFGVVFDALTNAPIQGAHVWVVPTGPMPIATDIALIIVGEAVTNEFGEYEIGGIPEGEYTVFVAKDGYRTGRHPALVIANQATEVNCPLQPIVDPTGNLVGSVRRADTEEPIFEAFVVLIPGDDTAFDLSRLPGDLRFTLTDENGHYAFRNVPVGLHQVLAVKDGFLPGIQAVLIHADQTAEAHFLLQPDVDPEFGGLAGHVFNAETGGPVVDAWVRVGRNEHDWLTSNGELATKTDGDGFYQFERLRVGMYHVEVVKHGFERAEAAADIHPEELTILDFELVPIPANGAIEGHVLDIFTNEPVPETLILVPLGDLPFSSNRDNTLWTRTDLEGRYRIEEVPPGQRIVVAVHPDYFPDAQVALVESGDTSRLDFGLIPWPFGRRSIRMRAVDAQTGQPLVGVRVSVPTNDFVEPGTEWDSFTGVTDAEGYVTIDGVPAGSWSIIASANGYRTVLTQLDANEDSGGTIELEFELNADGNAALDWTQYM